ncbi:MAG: hypothetical protein FJ296_10855 [Planctomycetes bacterium]|nr:hypothetical protein [Planctomycetota bacterium]
MKRFLLTAALSCAFLPACSSPEYTRAADEPEIEDPALSTRLDRRDLELALDAWIAELDGSAFAKTLPHKPSIAILHVQNDTSEHIAGALDNLLSSIETRLVQSGLFNVVDNTTLTRDAVLAERMRASGDAVDPATAAALGKEYGIHYLVNGRVGDTAEKTDDVRRVQYYLFLRVTEVATLRIMHQTQVDITKQENR